MFCVLLLVKPKPSKSFRGYNVALATVPKFSGPNLSAISIASRTLATLETPARCLAKISSSDAYCLLIASLSLSDVTLPPTFTTLPGVLTSMAPLMFSKSSIILSLAKLSLTVFCTTSPSASVYSKVSKSPLLFL